MTYFISDLHLGHKNVLQFDSRPFFTLEEMHEAIIRNWNQTVTDKDTVYLLGDVAWNDDIGYEIVKQLHGKKILVLGNHDNRIDRTRGLFEKVTQMAEIKVNGEFVVLSHYPMAVWNRSFYGSVHLYGHVHNSKESEMVRKHHECMIASGMKHECYNVGCMMPYMDYTPRTLEQIRASFK